MLTPDNRRELLKEYGRRYGLRTFVETGTYKGDTTWAVKDSFDVLYTIELAPKPHAIAARRFRSFNRVHCLLGDSAVMLPRVLSQINGPALFWLDGHYSGDGTAQGEKDTPVEEELMLILKEEEDHVILIDDARCFGDKCGCKPPSHRDRPGSYPTLQWVEGLARGSGYDYALKDDIVRLTRHQ